MKTGIVRASLVRREQRLDAAHYLGTPEADERAVELARKRLASAKKKLDDALARQKANRERVEKFKADGEAES